MHTQHTCLFVYLPYIYKTHSVHTAQDVHICNIVYRIHTHTSTGHAFLCTQFIHKHRTCMHATRCTEFMTQCSTNTLIPQSGGGGGRMEREKWDPVAMTEAGTKEATIAVKEEPGSWTP